MIAEDFVSRLVRPRKTGERSWSARCPAHDDNGPSLRITDADGTILIHCFAGCEPAAIVAAAGVALQDLFPPRDKREAVKYRREQFVKGTLQELRHELSVALIILGDVVNGVALDPEHHVNRAKRARAVIGRLIYELNGVE